jgi:hypothetical protein
MVAKNYYYYFASALKPGVLVSICINLGISLVPKFVGRFKKFSQEHRRLVGKLYA